MSVQKTNLDAIFSLFAVFLPIILAIVLGYVVSNRCGWLFYGLFSLFMCTRIVATALINVFLCRTTNPVSDAFWQLYYMFSGCLGVSIAICI